MDADLVVELAVRLAHVKLDAPARALAKNVVSSVGESDSMAELLDAFDRVPELRTFSSSLRDVIARQDAEQHRGE
jgi:hypothetical protein